MELNETLRFLEKDVNNNELKSSRLDSSQQKKEVVGGGGRQKTIDTDNSYSSFEVKLAQSNPSLRSKATILRNDTGTISATKRRMQEVVRNRYVYQKALLEEGVYNILYMRKHLK